MSALALQRFAVVVMAALAVGWLTVRCVDARTIDRIAAVIKEPGVGTARLQSALADARALGTLEPGSRAERLSVIAVVEIRLGRLKAAVATLEAAVRREPDSPEPLFLIAKLARRFNPALAARARAELRDLDPSVARTK